MTKTITTFGLIAGAVIVLSVLLSLAIDTSSTHMAALEWLGYAVMILAFSVIFVAIKGYRDKELGGVISFGMAFKVGIGITLIASLIYVVAWEINLAVTDYAFIEDYTQSIIDSRAADGASAEELAALTEEMDTMKAQYSRLLFRLPMTFLEIFPVGLLITLLSAAVLRNSRALPATG